MQGGAGRRRHKTAESRPIRWSLPGFHEFVLRRLEAVRWLNCSLERTGESQEAEGGSRNEEVIVRERPDGAEVRDAGTTHAVEGGVRAQKREPGQIRTQPETRAAGGKFIWLQVQFYRNQNEELIQKLDDYERLFQAKSDRDDQNETLKEKIMLRSHE